MPPAGVNELVDHLFRQEAGRMVSILTRLFGVHNLELVEDIMQDTLQEALLQWAPGRLPDNPPGWLMTVARRKSISAVKREKFMRRFARDTDVLLRSDWTAPYVMENVFMESEIKDAQLRMIFTACHPALPLEAQLAFCLRTLCGLSIPEIASALLTSESNINKRLYRAREKIRSLDFAVPLGGELLRRLDAVLFVLYLMFNEGYHSTGATTAIRKDLCLEAIRLGMLLVDRPDMEAYPQVYALLALMSFHAARFEARIDSKGCLIILEEQDRSLWDAGLISSGLAFLTRSSGGDALSEYHLEAAIAAEHAMAADFLSTDWSRIHYYYTALEALKPSAVVRLNLAIALGKKEGPAAAIPLLHALEPSLPGYPLLYASLGEFYFLSGDRSRARGYFSEARTLTRSPASAEVLDRKILACQNSEETGLPEL